MHFTAVWCGPCAAVRRVVTQVCAELPAVAHVEEREARALPGDDLDVPLLARAAHEARHPVALPQGDERRDLVRGVVMGGVGDGGRRRGRS